MSKEKRRVPKLRFPGFTEDWEQRKLTSFTQRVKGNDGRMDLPTLTISASEGWLNQKDRFSANIAGSEQKNYTLLRQGELSYNHGNSKLAKYGVVYVLKAYKEALVPRVYHSFKVDESYDALFVEYYFSTKRPDRELAKLVSSGARMDGLLNIGYDEFTNISIAVPTFSEQRQIVALLRRFDKIITLHQRKLEHLILKKKSLLQKLFPKNGERYPELRFPGFTDAWEQRKLSDILKVNSGKDYKHLDQGNIPVYGTGGYMLSVNESLSNIDAIGIGRKGTIDKPQYLKAPFWTVDTLFYLTALDKHSILFLYYLMQLIPWKKFDESTGVPSLSKTTIDNISGFVPSNSQEEELISALFNQLDKSITLHQRKLEHLQLQKKALLQQMFV